MPTVQTAMGVLVEVSYISCDRTETVDSLVFESLFRPEDCRWEFRMIGGVGIKLCFQADCVMLHMYIRVIIAPSR